jgi:hypothetical protein
VNTPYVRPGHYVRDLGFIEDVSHKARNPVPVYNGRHEWIVIAMFRVTNPARNQHMLDHETMLAIDGPGCLHCNQPWTPTIGSKCPGDPNPTQP